MKTLLEERKEKLNCILLTLSLYLTVNKDLILVSKAEEYVNTRYVLIKLLSEYYSDKEISDITGLTKMGVNNIKNRFDKRNNSKELKYICNVVKKDVVKHFYDK